MILSTDALSNGFKSFFTGSNSSAAPSQSRQSSLTDSPQSFVANVSPKVQTLIEALLDEWTPEFRASCSLIRGRRLWRWPILLQHHPSTNRSFTASSFVGTSGFAKKTDFTDMANLKEQEHALHDFRNGNKNLLVATNVLEEGMTSLNAVLSYALIHQ